MWRQEDGANDLSPRLLLQSPAPSRTAISGADLANMASVPVTSTPNAADLQMATSAAAMAAALQTVGNATMLDTLMRSYLAAPEGLAKEALAVAIFKIPGAPDFRAQQAGAVS